MREAQAAAYLARIGAARPARPDAAALRDLQRLHLYAVPFENLSIHLGEPIELTEEALVDKVVRRRRGGFCFELNGLFGALLAELGFPVTMLAAQVHGRAGYGPPLGHLVLRVDAPEPWLVDVGFGEFSQHPLRLDVYADQPDPAGAFRVTPGEHSTLEVAMDGEPRYRVEPTPRALPDFEPMCWWHQTSPASFFTRSLVCSLLTPAGRVTLSERTLVRTDGAGRHEQALAGDTEVLAAYRAHFGIALDRAPTLAAPPVGTAGADRPR